jgi:hypothetical protein
MARVKATRFLKVRDAVATLSQLPDATSSDDIKPFEELSEDDQSAVQIFSKSVIDLFDGLLDRPINVTTRVKRK